MPALSITDPKVVFSKEKSPGWSYTATGIDGGRFGRVEHIAVVDANGNFMFDTVTRFESAHVIDLAFGRDSVDGKVKLGLVNERRDTAAVELDGISSPNYWGPPRGFQEEDESLIEAARREAGEESGANTLIADPWVVAEDTVSNESNTRSRSPWVALPVDLAKISEPHPDATEKIFKSQFFTPEEISQMIVRGEHDGASTRSWCLATALLYFQLFILPKANALLPK